MQHKSAVFACALLVPSLFGCFFPGPEPTRGLGADRSFDGTAPLETELMLWPTVEAEELGADYAIEIVLTRNSFEPEYDERLALRGTTEIAMELRPGQWVVSTESTLHLTDIDRLLVGCEAEGCSFPIRIALDAAEYSEEELADTRLVVLGPPTEGGALVVASFE